jgi:hypothetical protein
MALEGVFGDRTVSRGLWPARSPDLTPCNFYLWGNLKDKVYRINPPYGRRVKGKHMKSNFRSSSGRS